MDQNERVLLIRKGNELYNQKKYDEAIKLFLKADYMDGIMRVADYYYYDMKQPLAALKFYRLINRKDRIDEINARIMYAFNRMLSEASVKKDESINTNEEIEVKVHPKLKILAEEIIRDNKGNE
jgi:tetratricopeptide (TPR) repeat protein